MFFYISATKIIYKTSFKAIFRFKTNTNSSSPFLKSVSEKDSAILPKMAKK